MFPVPTHLPRSASNGISSPSVETDSPDGVLDLLEPLFNAKSGKSSDSSTSNLSVEGVRDVLGKLQQAATDNKQRTHQLVLDNFPDISSHIRLGTQLNQNFTSLQNTLEGLEAQLDPNDAETSFLPPVLALVDRHFAAVQAKARADAHVRALKALQRTTDRLGRLEEAVWAGRGADDWVVQELTGAGYNVEHGSEGLEGTQVLRLSQQRLALFRSMVIEQVTDAFNKAVSFTSTPSSTSSGCTLTVQPKTSLQQPRIPRPAGSSTIQSTPPPYSLTHLFTTLSAFGTLEQTLTGLQSRLLRDIVGPLTSGRSHSRSNEAGQQLSFVLEPSTPDSSSRPPREILNDISTFLTFITTHISSPIEPHSDANTGDLPERTQFHQSLLTTTLQAVKDDILLKHMPATLAGVPAWLELIHQSLDLEDKYLPASGSDQSEKVILPFFEAHAGEQWAMQRRRRVGEEVRKLVLGGWSGWEAREVEREKEVVMVVEVEVEDTEIEASAGSKNTDGENGTQGDDGFGWGFDDDTPMKSDPADVTAAPQGTEEEAGWGFDDQAEAGPSSPRQSPANGNADSAPRQPDPRVAGPETGEGDGWDFDMDPTPALEPPKPVLTLAKPAKEAKKLGKRVKKVKAGVEEEEDDPWAMKDDPPDVLRAGAGDRAGLDGGYGAGEAEGGGWGWDEPEMESTQDRPRDQAQAEPARGDTSVPPAVTKRKELREERRTIRETFLISRATDKLVDMAERVLREAHDIQSEPPSPSFSSSPSILYQAITDIFDLYRSLLPAHYSLQLRDVPTLSMQLTNDAGYLANRIGKLAAGWPEAVDVVPRLTGLGDWAFERQLDSQRLGLMVVIEEAEGFVNLADEAGLRKAERAVGGVVRDIDTLARVLRAVLPTTTYLDVLGYLLDESILRITSQILDLNDITEVESERLSEVLRPIRALESVFTGAGDASGDGRGGTPCGAGGASNIVAHVPHWLKFCYISELLQANLVDILYLFDSGALVDFSTAELVSLVRALFADSEKRDGAIERIERGPAGISAEEV